MGLHLWLILMAIALVVVAVGMQRSRAARSRRSKRQTLQAIQLQQIRAERAIMELTLNAMQQMFEVARRS
ncbi:MAG TPA: hypothetical protein VJ851_04565 [Jatrophihabitans sp.]|nr:hypothetical protein [Jatrophihabitans sp.]